MIKKIATILIVLVMGITAVAVQGVSAQGNQLQGASVDSHDGTATLVDGTGNLNGNVTTVHYEENDDAFCDNTNGVGTDHSSSGYDDYQWDATSNEPYGWTTTPDDTDVGQNLYFIGEMSVSGVGYIFCTHSDLTDDTTIKPASTDMCGRLEPIPTPSSQALGPTYINLTIPHFKYSDYNYSQMDQTGQGTYDTFSSYAVFIRGGSYGSWSYLGNSQLDTTGSNAPLDAFGDSTDPSGIDTGTEYFNATGLTADTDYELMVRVNFGPSDMDGGYGGGLGSYTTYGAGASSGAIHTPTANEFPTILVPVMATMGLFIAAIYYRRTKE